MMTRLIAGAAVLVALVLGGSRSGGLTDEEGEQARALLAREVPPERAREAALASQPKYTSNAVYYRGELEATLTKLDMQVDVDATIEQLKQPNVFAHPISRSAPVLMKAGEQRSEQDLELAVVQEDLRVKSKGLESTSAHTLIRLHNKGSAPLAYRLVARSRDGGDCKMRAITQYDALVLEPDEQARISICSGSHEVEILDLRIMQVSKLSARWIRQIPVAALGLDEIATRSHKPTKHVPTCAQVPIRETAKLLEAGKAQWEDVVDFYGRHDCNSYRWPTSYTRIVEPLQTLPFAEE